MKEEFDDVIPTGWAAQENSLKASPPKRPALQGEAVVIKAGADYTAYTPVQKGAVYVRFSELAFSRHSIECVIEVEMKIEGEQYPPFSQRIDLRSASARKSLATDLNAAYGDKKAGYNWVLILNVIFNRVIESIKKEQHPVSVKGATYEQVKFLLFPFLQENVSNLLFASSEVGKTWFALRIALSLANGELFFSFTSPKGKKTLFLDYEDDVQTFSNRLHKLCTGMNVPFEEAAQYIEYYKPVGSLRSNVELIRSMVINNGFSFVIIDAGGDAAGGSPSDEEKVLDLFNAMEEIPGTKLVLHHEPKNVQNQDAAYYGSQYWKSRPRVGWRIKLETKNGDNVLIKASLEKKSNLGHRDPFYYWMKYGDDALYSLSGEIAPVTFEVADSEEVKKLLEKSKEESLGILDALIEPMTGKQLEEATGMPHASFLRAVYSLLNTKIITRTKQGREFIYSKNQLSI